MQCTGKDNVAADALSRVDFSYFKNLHNDTDSKICKIQTRAMSRKNEQSSPIVSQTINEEKQGFVYEALNNFHERKNCFAKFSINKEDTDFIDLSCTLYKANKKPIDHFSLKVVNVRDCPSTSSSKFHTIIRDELPSITFDLSKTLKHLFNKLESTLSEDKLNISMADELFSIFKVESFKEFGNKHLKKLKIVIVGSVKQIISDTEKLKLLEKYHNDHVEGGHAGTRRVYSKLRSYFYWPSMYDDVVKFVSNCHKCKINKPKIKITEEMVVTPTPQKPFDVVIVDTMGPLNVTENGNKYILCLVCDLSKYLVAIPIKNKEAKTVAKAIFEGFILIYGVMSEIRTDLGTEFNNSLVSELLETLGITHMKSSSYRHQTVGTAEKNHRTLNEYLRTYLDDRTDDWEDQLKSYIYCYNTTPSTAIDGFTPFEMIFGKVAKPLESFGKHTIDPVYNIDNYCREAKYRY